jgi:hypothetical protein
MMRISAEPDRTQFPDPHTWATWLRHRTPQFKTHKTLGIAKTACAGKMTRAGGQDVAFGDMYVYEWDGDSCTWQERYFIPDGATKGEVPLFQQTIPRKGSAMAPSNKALDEAISSILNAAD